MAASSTGAPLDVTLTVTVNVAIEPGPASPVHAGGRIYLQNEQGLCTVLAASRVYRKLGSTDLAEPILASAAIADGALFVRTENSLYRIE